MPAKKYEVSDLFLQRKRRVLARLGIANPGQVSPLIGVNLNWRTPHTKGLHMVERWKLLDGGNAIEATVTFDDHGAFKAPWSGMVRWSKMNGPILETVCAENNENYQNILGLSEYPMPEAKTSDF